ncbi:DUF4236 domain-containing protein [Brucella sp. 458]|uniref:DUF4236 domain-containing protein n=1 Tax=Brucella sp. 458 TaxID=2821140 RepID=UPI001FFC464B|nr:DUF4236 domain-containing protein [Brucella sp. 458]
MEQLPFYIRKSVSAGPFRFNFSKGGVGVSVGAKGLRIGPGPRGHYIPVETLLSIGTWDKTV